MIILTWAEGSIFLGYEEEGRGLGRFRGYNSSCSEVFFDKGFTGLHFCWVEQIDFGDFGDKVWMKFNGVIIGAMRGKLVMGCLREDISKVFAPVRYNWFG